MASTKRPRATCCAEPESRRMARSDSSDATWRLTCGPNTSSRASSGVRITISVSRSRRASSLDASSAETVQREGPADAGGRGEHDPRGGRRLQPVDQCGQAAAVPLVAERDGARHADAGARADGQHQRVIGRVRPRRQPDDARPARPPRRCRGGTGRRRRTRSPGVVLRHTAAVQRRRRGRGPERRRRRRGDELDLDPVLRERPQGEQQLGRGDASPGDQRTRGFLADVP